MISFLKFVNENYNSFKQTENQPYPSRRTVYEIVVNGKREYRWRSTGHELSLENLEIYLRGCLKIKNSKILERVKSELIKVRKEKNRIRSEQKKKELEERRKYRLKYEMPKEEIPCGKDIPISKIFDYLKNLKKEDEFEIPFLGYSAKIVKNQNTPNTDSDDIKLYVTSVKDKEKNEKYVGKTFEISGKILRRTLARLNRAKKILQGNLEKDEIELIKNLKEQLPDDFTVEFGRNTNDQVELIGDDHGRKLRFTYDARITDIQTGQQYVLEFNGIHIHSKSKYQKYNYGLFKGQPWTLNGDGKVSAGKKCNYDNKKMKLAIKQGYATIIIWSDEYEDDMEGTVNKTALDLKSQREKILDKRKEIEKNKDIIQNKEVKENNE